MIHRILIVDDDKEIRELFELILENEGYKVDSADSGKEAIKKASTNRYSLALLDFILSDMKGTDLAKDLYTNYQINDLIFITGHDQIEFHLEQDIKKISKVYFKPIDLEKFVKEVNMILKAIEALELYELPADIE